MIVSVIIPTRNRARYLADCLQSLLAQDAGPEAFEVIVVDNGSTDDTRSVAEAFAGRLPLRCLEASTPGLHVGRHVGMAAAASDLLTFCDDDIVAPPGWISCIARAFADPTVAMVGGNNHPRFEATPPGWLTHWWQRPPGKPRVLPTLSILDLGEGRFDISPHLVWGCNFSIRRQVLLDAGGFHPDGVPADMIRLRGDGETHVSEHVLRSGSRAVFDSGASVFHRVGADRMTEDYFCRRAFAQGVSDSYTEFRRAGMPDAPVGKSRPRRIARLREWLSAQASALGGRDGRALRRVRLAMMAAYGKGYTFHRTELGHDPDLRRWVQRERYY